VLKYEEIYPREYSTIDYVIRRLPKFIEEYYNQRRLHSSLGYRPPDEFERLHSHPAALVKVCSSNCPSTGVHSRSVQFSTGANTT
jgi:Integrase core domain